ncbi:Protein CBG10370 [Caenorhabditis briggsae]|uniref:Protein CBG10370 n=1 Tax=Caenorhabditis briggsae TaxID=6238 RepID=A8XB22_CAEBR|nr:Protein CBG10370 [Caenorhabditis briggsae]CAP29802.2 Protein CBG10370 [Caenorhabditis briggsae]
MTCIPPTSFFATPEYLKLALHRATAISVPIHCFGLYCVLFKTPEQMKSVKLYFINLNLWIVLYDYSVCILTVPLLLIPTFAGYSLGILEDFGVPNIIQTTAVFLFLIYVLISILAIFENRFHVVCNFRWKVKWTLVRRYWLGIHYFVGLVVLIPFFFLVPDQREARIAVLKFNSQQGTFSWVPSSLFFQQLPCLPDYITNAPLFITSDDYTYHVTSLALFLVIGITESVIFILLLVSNTIQQLRAKKMSQKLFEIQKKFFIALVIQMLVPSIFLLIPLWYAVFSILFGYYNQAAINISVTMESIHGLVSTLVMIFIHRPYREAFFDIFGRSLVMKDDQNRSNIKVG